MAALPIKSIVPMSNQPATTSSVNSVHGPKHLVASAGVFIVGDKPPV
jgi:hypothetical protein